MTELKSCPFCSSPAEVYARTDHVYQESPDFIEAMWIADCTVCNANMELEETQEKAIELWNTRAPDLAMQKREDALVKSLQKAKEYFEFILHENDTRINITDSRDKEIGEMCERLGYGCVMDAASRLWQNKGVHGKSGAFIVGHCVSIVRAELEAIEAALKSIKE